MNLVHGVAKVRCLAQVSPSGYVFAMEVGETPEDCGEEHVPQYPNGIWDSKSVSPETWAEVRAAKFTVHSCDLLWSQRAIEELKAVFPYLDWYAWDPAV